jgi:hypothetical protein
MTASPRSILVLSCFVTLVGLGLQACDTRTPADTVMQVKNISDVVVDHTIPDQPRHYIMGAVAIGAAEPNASVESLDHLIEKASQIAECIVIRPLIDWSHFRPGGTAEPERLQEVLDIIRRARSYGMPYCIVELDPILSRHEVSPLPPEMAGQNFSSPDVRAALRGMALAVAEQAKPTYLSFGVEINGYYDSNPNDFANLVSLHKELYDEVKAVSPGTKITVAFNYEAMQGLLAGLDDYSTHGTRFFLIDMFEPKIDAVAFSTLPWPIFPAPVNMPEDYISKLQNHTKRPILLSETGWTTADEAGSNEGKQMDYVAMMARQALRTPQLELMSWSVMADPPSGTVFEAFPSFMHLGLFRQDLSSKPAMALWKELLSRPYRPISP